MDASSKRIVVLSSYGIAAEDPLKVHLASKTGGIYFIEIKLGRMTKEVIVDAHNGKILLQRDITAKPA